MTHRPRAIWTERMLLGLILFSLAGTLNLLVAIHRRASADHRAATATAGLDTPVSRPATPDEPRAPAPSPPESPALVEKPEPAPAPAEDPTKKALASLAAAAAKEIAATDDTDRRTRAMEDAYRSAVAESDRWKRREMLVRQQIAGITADAEKLEHDADALDAERDVLERERDATKAALAKAARGRDSRSCPTKDPTEPGAGRS